MKLVAAVVLSLSLAGAAYADDSAETWKAKCKGCHGETGKADTKVGQKEAIADFSSAEFQKHHSDEELRKVIAEGSETNTKMKAFKDRLSPAEIDGLVKYIRAMNAGGGKTEKPAAAK